MQRSIFFSTFLFAAVLSPITLQGYNCAPPEDARLAILELRVGSFHGENVIEGFDPSVFSYEARFPESESVGVLWVRTKHPSQSIEVQYDGMPVKLVGQSVAKLDVPLGSSELTIDVATRGPMPDSQRYVVRVERVPVFACTEQGIREAIARGGGPIYFDCNEPTVVPTEAEIVIDNDVILDGEGNLIVDGGSAVSLTAGEVAPKVNGAHRVFSISEGVTAELIGFTVTGGSTPGDGGGILNAGTFTLADSTVTENTADRGGGVASLETGTLAVIGSTISGNNANLAAGIGNAGTAEMIETTVSGNTALISGGGVGIASGGTLTLSSSIVEGNSAAEGAGGVGSEADTMVTLNNTAVSDNEAGTVGGGIQNAGTLILNDSTVSQNSALEVNGGGLWNGDTGVATLTNSTMSENTAALFGGAVDNFGSLTLVKSTLSRNVSRDGGGAVLNEGAAVLTLASSTVSDNATTVGAGGGILQVASQTVMLTDSTVTGNETPDIGGGIAIGTGSAVVMADTTVSGNTAASGGGIWAAGPSSLMMTGSTVSDNRALDVGGGIQSFGDVTLIESAVSRNSADFDGGVAIGGVAEMIGTTISDNSARFATGGIGVATSDTARLTMSSCLVVGNSAADRAGIANGGAVTLVDSVVSRNIATELDGGGILNDETATLVVARSTVSQNTAGRFGGGIRNLGVAEVIDTTVSGNTSMQASGGISNRATLMLTRSTVTENFAAGRGGGVGNVGTATLTNVTVSGNEAGDFAGGIRNGDFPTYGTLHLVSTTVSRNFAPNGATAIRNDALVTARNTIIDGDCQLFSPLDSFGGNIESPGNTCSLIPGIDLINVRATQLGLGPLANNGGPTETQALAPFSVALDRISAPECVDGNGFPLLTDQRGVPRPQGPACDSGAFELADGPQPTGACINDADRATYEMLVYVNGDGVPAACIDAAAAIGADCIFGSATSSPPLEGCGPEAAAVLGCFPNCSEEVIGQLAGCVANCTAGATGLSGGCVTCYGDAVACGAAFCTPQCVSDVNSPQCIECRTENGCISGFDTCSGLPGDIDCGGTGGTGGTGGNNPPVIGYVAWEYGVDCEGFGATTLQVTVSANDADDPTGETLTYSGSLQWCDPFSVTSTPSPVTETVNCELSLGLESLAVTVADPQGNEDTISAFFESALCQGGCVENPEGEVGCPGGTGGTGGAGGTGGSGGTAGTGGAPMLCADGQLRCSADLARIEICFNDVWEHFEDCPPPSECKEEPDVSCVEPSVIVGDGIWQGNGHQYVVVEFRGQTWNTANADLSAQLPGFHLATITSQEEQDFVDNLVAGLASGELWLGGFQDPITELNPAAGWTWVTGEPWAYTNWLSGEPNDTIGVEQHLALDRGGWNDEGSAIGAVGGYLAESFDPVAP